MQTLFNDTNSLLSSSEDFGDFTPLMLGPDQENASEIDLLFPLP
jgi:hypothetical protein